MPARDVAAPKELSVNESHRLDLLLSRSAQQSPNNVAVEDPGRSSLSYAELRAVADTIAEALRKAGVREGDRVGICAPKSVGTVAAIFGILTAKAAYVPVDYSAPGERNSYIFNDCNVRAIVTTERLLASLFGDGSFAVAGKMTDPAGRRSRSDHRRARESVEVGSASAAGARVHPVHVRLDRQTEGRDAFARHRAQPSSTGARRSSSRRLPIASPRMRRSTSTCRFSISTCRCSTARRSC